MYYMYIIINKKNIYRSSKIHVVHVHGCMFGTTTTPNRSIVSELFKNLPDTSDQTVAIRQRAF